MTREADALRALVPLAETARVRTDLPVELLRAGKVNARLAWRAVEGTHGSLDAACRLEGGDPAAEARSRLLAELRRRLDAAEAAR